MAGQVLASSTHIHGRGSPCDKCSSIGMDRLGWLCLAVVRVSVWVSVLSTDPHAGRVAVAFPRLTRADILEALSDRSTGLSAATSPFPALGLGWLRWPLGSQPDLNSNLVEQKGDAKKGEHWERAPRLLLPESLRVHCQPFLSGSPCLASLGISLLPSQLSWPLAGTHHAHAIQPSASLLSSTAFLCLHLFRSLRDTQHSQLLLFLETSGFPDIAHAWPPPTSLATLAPSPPLLFPLAWPWPSSLCTPPGPPPGA